MNESAIGDLDGQVALVTGATSGIGRAIALQLAKQGASVVVHGRDVDRGVQVVEEIELSGGTARFVSVDLSDPQKAPVLASEAGDVDILVNNAGFSWFGPTADLDAITLDRLFASNVQAPYLLVAAIAPKMVERAEEASSTSPAWPEPSVWREERPMAPRRRRSLRSRDPGQRSSAPEVYE